MGLTRENAAISFCALRNVFTLCRAAVRIFGRMDEKYLGVSALQPGMEIRSQDAFVIIKSSRDYFRA